MCMLMHACFVFVISTGYSGDQGVPGKDGDQGAPGDPGQQGLHGFPGNRGLPVSYIHNDNLICAYGSFLLTYSHC